MAKGIFNSGSSGNNVSSGSVCYSNTVTLTEASSTFSIGISEFNASTDRILIYEGGIYQSIPQEITVTSTTATNVLGTWEIGTQFDILVIKNSNISTVKYTTISTTWVGSIAPYTQTISVQGISSNSIPIVCPVYSSDIATALLEKTAWSLVSKIDTATDSIIVTCFEEKPITPINIKIKEI